MDVEVVWAARSDRLLVEPLRRLNEMTITVVICDDHPAFARGLQRLLHDEAPDLVVVNVATSGEDLERVVGEVLPDVVLMDIRMPGIGGIEATRRVRSASPSTVVVMLTASDDQGDLYEALRAGAAGYVVKDRDVSEIAGAIRSAATGHLVIPAHLAGTIVSDLDSSTGQLNDVEREILAGIATGETNRELGQRLHMSERTVRRRVEDIYSKLHLADRIEAAIYAAEHGYGVATRPPQSRGR